jgi:hypothetical protein
MRLEMFNGDYVGAVEWRGPGEVAMDVDDPMQREFFEAYFAGEDSYLSGPVECAEMTYARRDSSEQSFTHAAFQLAAYAYTVKSAEPHGEGRGG